MEVKTKPAGIEEVTITLKEFETGYIRSILLSYDTLEGPGGICTELYDILNALNLPNYDAEFPDWKKEAIGRGKR